MPSSSTEDPGRRPGGAGERPGSRGSLRANILVSVASTLVVLLLAEGFASVLMSVRAAKHVVRMREESHVKYDADLGWSNRPDLRLENFYEEGADFTTNSQGFRARENFDKAVPPGRFRIVALGDSFTLGFGVGDDRAYPAQMQALCPALQTVNMGQGGYGVDQDYLWYKRDGVNLDANLLLFAVIAHDFYRMQSDHFVGYGKPVLRVRNNALAVENVPPPAWTWRTPLRRAGEFFDSLAVARTGRWLIGGGAPPSDSFYGALGDDVLAAAQLAYDDLARLSRSRGQHFVVAYLPTGDLLAREPTPEAAWLEAYARRAGIPLINLVAEFDRLTPAQLARMFRPDNHYTVEGNRFVAEALLRGLGEQVAGFPDCSGRPP